jgi:DNA excision repair protein ERCC-2
VEGLPAATTVVSSSNGTTTNNTNSTVQTLPAAPVLPEDILAEAVPGNIRRAEHFLSFLNGVVEFLKKSIDVKDVVKKIPTTLRSELLEFLEITDRKPLRFCYTRLNRLLRTLEITDVAEYTPLSLVADFTTVLATYDEGFMLIIEPTQSHAPNLVDPLMQLTCT